MKFHWLTNYNGVLQPGVRNQTKNNYYNLVESYPMLSRTLTEFYAFNTHLKC